MIPKGWDFAGWATKNDLTCSDGRIIRRNAFKVNDGQRVPLVWNHGHNSPKDVLGHAVLENRDEGVYAYAYFNDTENGQDAKKQVKHGDVNALSIWANNLQQKGHEVLHGVIREVSLVLAGANPGAFIESVLAHRLPMEDYDDEGIFYVDSSNIVLAHAEKEDKMAEETKNEEKKQEEPSNDNSKTVKDVYETLNDEQKKVVAFLVGSAIQDSKSDEKSKKEDEEMKHNVFDTEDQVTFLSHSDIKQIFDDAKRVGSLKAVVTDFMETHEELRHALDTTGMETHTGNQTYGFNDPEMLFPEYQSLNNPPEWISRNMDWVQEVMGSVHRTPFSRVKSQYANITEDEARAKGYIKGKQKKTEVFSILKRTTDPTTIYKLQKMDRDDIIDITGFDVVAWIRAEMRVMLNEEIARAILMGDGREAHEEDHIPEDHIRPIVSDVPLFNTKIVVPAATTGEAPSDVVASDTIDAIIRSRKHYKGSGNPTFFTTEDVLTEMLLVKDAVGHRMYKSEAELATALRVRKIVTVEPMEGYTVEDNEKKKRELVGVIVNLSDYNVGADKGGQVNMFDDFDLDFNKYTYLIETRISGALVKPFSAVTILGKESA